MPDLKPFIVLGLALGGVFALSGVGLVVLFRATGVVNLAYGAIGAFGALITWQLINEAGWNQWLAFLVCLLFGGAVTLAYGYLFGPLLAARDPLVKATATLGGLLFLLGLASLIGGDDARSIVLPTTSHGFNIGEVRVNYTQIIAL